MAFSCRAGIVSCVAQLKSSAPRDAAHRPKAFVVEVTLYSTAHGGRKGPTPSEWFGCPCIADQHRRQAWDCRLLLKGSSLSPGETRRVEITFLSAEQAFDALSKGDKFFLWEGRVIGEARFVYPETLDGPGERK